MIPTPSAVTVIGLMEAFRNIAVKIGIGLLLTIASSLLAIGFWYVRALVGSINLEGYKWYAVTLDTSLFGSLPSLWLQTHVRSSFLDSCFRYVWWTYLYCLLFGVTIIYVVKGETKRLLMATGLALFAGLVFHCILLTQPPWMAVEGITRIKGAQFSDLDRNLIAAMPSIHQTVVCLFCCPFWNLGVTGKCFGILYNTAMAFALVYLGEHYTIDAFAGIMLAVACWHMSGRLTKWCPGNNIRRMPARTGLRSAPLYGLSRAVNNSNEREV